MGKIKRTFKKITEYTVLGSAVVFLISSAALDFITEVENKPIDNARDKLGLDTKEQHYCTSGKRKKKHRQKNHN